MNLAIDSAIFERQRTGGISKIWNALIPRLAHSFGVAAALADADVFISTYYRRAPLGLPSLVLVYDMIAERYPGVGRFHPDGVDKRRAIAEATRIVAISEQTACDVTKFTGRKVDAIAYPGIERDYGIVLMDKVDQFRAFVGKPYLLVVGNRGLYKNVSVLYQAWGTWEPRDKYAIVCIGGETALPQDAAFDAKFPGVRKVMQLSDADMSVAYSGASALVYPSLIEGFGLPPLEAMACGCPVVCGETMREVCGNHAHYADVTRPKDVQRALYEVVDAPMVVKPCLEQFCWDKMAGTIAQVIRGMR